MGIASLLLGENNPFTQWVGQHQNQIGAFGAGLGQGQNIQSGLSAGLSMVPQAKQLDRQAAEKLKADKLAESQLSMTANWLQSNYPQYANLPPEQGFKLAMEAEQAKYNSSASTPENFFGNPIPFEGEDGQIQFGQIGNRGTFKPIDLGGQGQFVSPTKTVNTETEQIVMDNFGNVLSRIPIQNQTAAFDTATGKGLGEANAASIVAAPKDISAGESALSVLDQIRKHPALMTATGATAPLNQFLVGTTRFDFENLVNQAKSGAFLTAIEQMRGLGALSNAEGQAATQAITRMNTASTKDGFLRAVADYEAIVKQGMARAQAKLPPDSGGGAAPVGNDPLGLR